MSERADIARLERMLTERRLAFVVVAAHAKDDRAVPMFIERDGATVHSPEYLALLRDIVRTVRGRRS